MIKYCSEFKRRGRQKNKRRKRREGGEEGMGEGGREEKRKKKILFNKTDLKSNHYFWERIETDYNNNF